MMCMNVKMLAATMVAVVALAAGAWAQELWTSGTTTVALGADMTMTVSGTGDMENYSSGAAPWLPYRNFINRVVIENGVTSVGDNAFYACSSMTSLTIGNGVTTVGNGAFYNCNKLTSLIIGNGVTTIGDGAFYNCNGLTSLTIGDGLTSVGDFNEVSDFPNLTNIEVGEGNTIYSSVDGVLFDKNKTTLYNYPRGKQGAYSIPDGVAYIAGRAFANNSGLTSVTIPNSVTTIVDGAFMNCAGLTSVTIGDGVTYIGRWAFANDSGLTSITIPNSVLNIQDSAFTNCAGLTSVTIGNGVTSIGDWAFGGCDGLTTATFLAAVPPATIGSSAIHWSTCLSVPDAGVAAYRSQFGVIYCINGALGAGLEKPAASGDTVTINNAKQLAFLAAAVNNGISAYHIGKHIKLTDDIDLSAHGEGSAFNGGKGWIPIGTESNPFGGFFNGNGHKITGLYINDAALDYAGLFGRIGTGITGSCYQITSGTHGTVEKLALEGVNITARNYVGGVAGFIGGWSNTSNVEFISLVTFSYVTGSVSGGNRVGGIVGSSDAYGWVGSSDTYGGVGPCWSTAEVSGLNRVGGIAGDVDGGVGNSAALNTRVSGTGTYVGRVAGHRITRGDDGINYDITWPILENNAAFDGILTRAGTTFWLHAGADSIDGLAMTKTAINIDGTLGGRFTVDDGIWAVQDDALPGFGAPVAMPAHLYTEIGYAEAPAITSLTESKTVEIWSVAELSVAAAASGVLSYRWYRNTTASNAGGAAIAGATGSTYDVPTNAAGTFYYYVVVANSSTSGDLRPSRVTSDVVTVTISTGINYEAPAVSGDTVTINNAKQLAFLAGAVKNGLSDYHLGKHIILTADIDLSAYGEGSAFNGGKGWVPIGTESNPFGGFFNGNGHKITGLYINDATLDYAGLFGRIGEGDWHTASGAHGTVERLALVDVNVTAKRYVGGVVGFICGWSNRNDDEFLSSVTHSYVTGSVSSVGSYVGGIVGSISGYAYMHNCWSTAEVDGSGWWFVGGIAGDVDGGLTYSAALNTRVSCGSGFVGRVAGSRIVGQDVTWTVLENNAAFDGILTRDNTTSWLHAGADSIDGLAMTKTAINIDGTLGGRFTDDYGIWAVQDGFLPGFGAPVAMPEHLIVPVITSLTESTSVKAGDEVELSVTASVSAGVLTYQWYRNTTESSAGGAAIAGATGSTYAVPTSAAGTFYYYVVVTSSSASGNMHPSSVTSDVVTVTVAPVYYTVTFDSQGGSAVPEQSVEYDGKVTEPADPTRANYYFYGWFKEAACTHEWDFGGDVVTAAVTLYAKWTTTVPSHAVHFDTQGGSAVSSEHVEEGKKATEPAAPTLAGHTFGGWYKEPACTNEWDFGTEITETVTLYAKWTINTYEVTFSAGANGGIAATVDGSAITTGELVQYGKSVIFTATPNDGYDVIGWTLNGSAVASADDNDNIYTLSVSAAAVVAVSFGKTNAIAQSDRVIPAVKPKEEATVIAPVSQLTGEFTAGPNPVAKQSGSVSFFRQGKRVANSELRIYDATGNVINKVKISDKALNNQARHQVGTWDLKDAKGRPVSEGTYLVKGVIKASDGKSEKVSVILSVR